MVLLLLLLAFSCEKISNETDPAKIILGKWEIIEFGSWPVMDAVEDPGGYIKYLHDSIKIEYASDTKKYFQIKYWIDSLLHEGTERYRYDFFDKNQKMRLDFASGIAEFPTSIWQRIK